MATDLDNVDRGILHLLQRDARNTTAKEIADVTGVSPSTVRNRIADLEDSGIITGYHPMIDYEAADFPLQVLFVVTAQPHDRNDAIEELLNIKGVVDIRETLTGRRNIYVEAVGTSTRDVTRISNSIHDLDIQIESSEIVKQRRSQPFNHFHYEGNLPIDRERSDR